MSFGIVSIGLGVPPELCQECIKQCFQCDEFEHPKALRNFTIVRGLGWIGEECVSRSATLDDKEELFIQLLTKGQPPLKPALVDLLGALADHYQEQEHWRGKVFKDLKEKVSNALLEAEKSEQPKDYQQLVEVRTPSDRRPEEKTGRQWIEEADDNLDELALRITLAVLNGTTFEAIEIAKSSLLELLQELMPPPSPEDPPAPIIHVPLMRRLESAGAKATIAKPPDWRSVIELERPGLASEAIRHVWQFYKETPRRQKLIEWLTKCAGGRWADVRTRAAVAAGRLATKDYRFVRDHLLSRWVKKNDAKYRMAIGMALGVIVREETWGAAEVQSLLWKWSKSTEMEERWAAMRAYVYVGTFCRPISEVIARWREIASYESLGVYLEVSENNFVLLRNPMYMSLVDAMMRFFMDVAQQPTEKKRSHFTEILAGLSEWMVDPKGDAGLGLFMFTTLGRLIVNPVGSEELDSPPVLLQLVEEQSAETDYRKRLAQLFALALRSGATVIETKELLCAWLGWANSLQVNGQLYERRLQTLFMDIIAADESGRMHGRLVACLRDCGRNRIAGQVLSGLGG